MDHTSEKAVGLEVEPKESYWITAWKQCTGVLFAREGKIFLIFAGIFLFAYYLPLGNAKVQEAILEAFKMLQAYARNHTLTCVVPALFIAGAIITFLSQAAVMRYLGPTANKFLAYTVARPGELPHLRRLGHAPGRHHPPARRAKGAGGGPGGAGQ